MSKRKQYWAVVSRSHGKPIKTMERYAPLAIYEKKETAIQARIDRFTFKDQMERETVIKRIYL